MTFILLGHLAYICTTLILPFVLQDYKDMDNTSSCPFWGDW